LNQLETFHITATRSTPEVLFDYKRQVLSLRGVSSPEKTTDFYQPIFELIPQIAQLPQPSLHVELQLVHFNSSSAKALFQLLQTTETHFLSDHLSINWYCDEDDDDMIEAAEDFSDMLDININILINEEI